MVTQKQSRAPLKQMLWTMSALAAMTTAAHAQTNAPTEQQAQYEIWFLRNMIDHHNQAIAMSNLAPSRTDNPSILQAASTVVANDSAEIATMQGWLQSWYGEYYQPVDASGYTSSLSGLSGPAFDYSWIRMMTAHERASMQAARAAQGRAWHDDLRAAAASIANTDFSRIQTLNDWMRVPVNGYTSLNGGNISPIGRDPWIPGQRAYMGSGINTTAPVMQMGTYPGLSSPMVVSGANVAPSGLNPWIPGQRAYMALPGGGGGPNVDASGLNPWIPGQRAYMTIPGSNGPNVAPSGLNPYIPGQRAYMNMRSQ